MAVRLASGRPDKDALKKAAELFVKAIKSAASEFSTEIPPTVHMYFSHDFAFVSAGSRGGQWGWEPIHAWMFDEPHAGSIPKHPLFGDRKHWYYQPYRPFMEQGASAALDAAEELYADIWIAEWAAESGFK